jgi:transposase-like protein
MQVQVSLTIEIPASASISEMEQRIQEAGQQAMREALKQAIRQREDQQVACPHCGQKQRRLEGTTRRVIATVFGRVEVPRRRFRCQGCLRRWCPANRLLAELGGGTVSKSLQEAAVLAGSSWPYRVASQLLQKLSGAHISAEEIRLLTNQQGKQRAAHQQAEAERICTSRAAVAPAAAQAEQPLLVGVDGGWVCSRDQRGGMEGKVAVVCSEVEDLPMPTSSTTYSWSERGPRRPPRQRHRLARLRSVTFKIMQALRGRCWAYQTLFTE